jgi:hypothetical protein
VLHEALPPVHEWGRYAACGQGFGDYERRTGTVSDTGHLGRNTSTWDSRSDATYRNLGWAGDILVAGLRDILKALIDGLSASTCYLPMDRYRSIS